MLAGRQTREQALACYGAFSDAHEWKFNWMLNTQRAIPRVPPKALASFIRFVSRRKLVDFSFSHYLNIAPPSYAREHALVPERRALAQVA